MANSFLKSKDPDAERSALVYLDKCLDVISNPSGTLSSHFRLLLPPLTPKAREKFAIKLVTCIYKEENTKRL